MRQAAKDYMRQSRLNQKRGNEVARVPDDLDGTDAQQIMDDIIRSGILGLSLSHQHFPRFITVLPEIGV